MKSHPAYLAEVYLAARLVFILFCSVLFWFSTSSFSLNGQVPSSVYPIMTLKVYLYCSVVSNNNTICSSSLGSRSLGGEQSFQDTSPTGQPMFFPKLELFPTDGIPLPRLDMGLGMQGMDILTSGRHKMLGCP